MLALLPAAFFAQVCFYIFQRNGFRGIRESGLKGVLVLASLVAFGTEALSLFTAVDSLCVSVFWVGANLCIGGLVVRGRASSSNSIRTRASEFSAFSSEWASEGETRTFLLAAASIYAVVLATALYAPPNTADSLTYHMPRVAHWIQQGSVGHYATAVLRQLYQNPLAEYAVLHLQLLAGDDRFANLVQFSAFVGCGAAASLVCGDFGLDRKVQAAAVAIAATVPMAIAQGSSTKNDLVVAFFTLCFFLFFLRFASRGRLGDSVYSGLALGAALLSKGTALPFCFAVGTVIFAAYFLVKRPAAERVRFAARTALTGAIALAIVAPMMIRNVGTFGSPVTTGVDKVSNERMSPTIAASNLYRNYAVHLGTISADANALLKTTGERLFGAELNDPASTFLRFPFDVTFSLHEDLAGNLLHLLLITLSLPVVLLSRRAVEKRQLAVGALVIIVGFLAYCLLIKWQPWAARLHMPLFMLGVPLAAAALARLGGRARMAAVLACVVGCLPFLLIGEPRSVLPFTFRSVFEMDRHEQYLQSGEIDAVYEDAAQFLREQDASEVGLYFVQSPTVDCGEHEYAIWIHLKDDFAAGPSIRHVGVENVSARLDDKPSPEWVIATRPENSIDGVRYTEAWKNNFLRILRRDDR